MYLILSLPQQDGVLYAKNYYVLSASGIVVSSSSNVSLLHSHTNTCMEVLWLVLPATSLTTNIVLCMETSAYVERECTPQYTECTMYIYIHSSYGRLVSYADPPPKLPILVWCIPSA